MSVWMLGWILSTTFHAITNMAATTAHTTFTRGATILTDVASRNIDCFFSKPASMLQLMSLLCTRSIHGPADKKLQELSTWDSSWDQSGCRDPHYGCTWLEWAAARSLFQGHCIHEWVQTSVSFRLLHVNNCLFSRISDKRLLYESDVALSDFKLLLCDSTRL